jgi:hypothetical protein
MVDPPGIATYPKVKIADIGKQLLYSNGFGIGSRGGIPSGRVPMNPGVETLRPT